MADLNYLISPFFLNNKEIKKIIELIFFSYRDFTAGPDKILEKINFGRAHHRVIYFVGKKNNITIKELLIVLKITKQSLSRVLSQLVKEGFIIVSTGLDKRTKTLSLTQEGLNLEKQLSIVWDCGNGSAGPAVEALCKRLPGKHKILFSEVNGDFPNHHPDPTVKANLESLITSIKMENADLGIAFDGDGDRIGVVDNHGEIIWGDQLLAILAEDVLIERNGATIIGDVKASKILFDQIAKLGGKPLMWKTGHSLIKTKMSEVDAPLAGEMSGHIFFRDKYYGFDDALYAAVRIIELLDTRNDKLSSIRAKLPRMVNTPELRFECAEDEKFIVVEKAKNYLRAKENVSVSTIDGVRVSSVHGWWLLRASNTQAALVARCEADTLKNLDVVKQDLRDLLENVGILEPNF